jgi:TonB family protein
MKSSHRSHVLVLSLLVLGMAPAFASTPNPIGNRPAELISSVTPVYPYMMRRAEATAEVTISFTVNSHGVVTKATVLESSNIDFNAAALDAIRKWTFKPASNDGISVGAKLQQTFKFSVQDKRSVTVTPAFAANLAR